MEESKSETCKWGDLTAKEEQEKLLAIGALLKEHGLLEIHPMSADHQVNLLKSGFTQKQSRLLITGTVPASQALGAKKFVSRVKEEVLSGINPYTYLIRIDARSPAAGDDFSACTGLRSLHTGEVCDLAAKEGQAMLINFWSTTCELSALVAQTFSAIAQGKITEARVVNVNVNESFDEAKKFIEDWGPHENFHINTSAADLIYRTVMIPRIVLVDIHGKLVYCGHPEKVDLQTAMPALTAGQPLHLDPEVLAQDDFSKDVTLTAADSKGTFSRDHDLVKIKDEMAAFSKDINTKFREIEAVKQHLDGLFSDTITILRQTKVNPETGDLLSKYLLITMMAGRQQALADIRSHLEAYLATFGGSFEREWELTTL